MVAVFTRDTTDTVFGNSVGAVHSTGIVGVGDGAAVPAGDPTDTLAAGHCC